jgi:hypothetical protein
MNGLTFRQVVASCAGSVVKLLSDKAYRKYFQSHVVVSEKKRTFAKDYMFRN